MNLELAKQAVLNDITGILNPVYETAWSIVPKSKLEVYEIANQVNTELGYELFDDLYYPRLILNFRDVTKLAQENIMRSK